MASGDGRNQSSLLRVASGFSHVLESEIQFLSISQDALEEHMELQEHQGSRK